MQKVFLSLIGGFILSNLVFAQQVVVTGVVSDEANNPLEMANIIAMSASDSSMAGFAFSDSKGNYELRVNAGANYFIRISYMGYETWEKPFTASKEKSPIKINARLKEQPEYLDEVQVVEDMPVVISGDTISYKAEAFNKGTEKKLEDVLENLPGVEIEDDGQIKVEGKTVEKVLVEGKEFFDGDTKIATKNIPASAVDKVQVLRNYNDVTPLGGVTQNDDRIALNIKLKDGKKSMVFGDVEAAVGPNERYLLHPNIFYYTPKASVNFIGDVNNVGQPAFTRRDYFRFTGGFRSLASRSGSNLNIGSDIGIPMGTNDRNLEITSEFGAANFNLNPNKAWSINGFVIANHNNIITKTNTLNNYVGQNEGVNQEILNSDETQEDHSVLGKLTAQYTPSSQVHIAYDGFLKYNSIYSGEQKLSTFSDTLQRNIFSGNTQDPIELNNNLEAVWDINGKSIISFEGQYLYKKQDPLFNLITDAQLNFGFLPALDSGEYNLNQSRLITTNKIDGVFNYYYILNKTNHVDVSLGGSYSHQRLHTGITQIIGETVLEIDSTDFVNNNTFRLSDIFAGVHYKTKLGDLTIRPGINVHQYHTNDLQHGGELQRDWLLFLPDLFVKYDFKKSESLTLDYSMNASFTDVNNAALGIILQSYNSLFQGNQYLDNALYHSATLRYFSFNMFNYTNIYAGLTYNKRIRDITNTVTYVGIDRVNSPINSLNANDVYTAFAGYSRRIGYYRIGFRGNVSYSLTNNLINGEQNTNGSLNQSYRAEFGTNFKEAPNVKLGYRVAFNNYSGSNVSNEFINHMPFVEFEATIFKQFFFSATYDYNYYTSPTTGPSSIFDFLDANLYYNTKNEKWEFKIGATNVLDTRIIRQDNFTNSVTNTQEIYVLPRYVLFGVKYKL